MVQLAFEFFFSVTYWAELCRTLLRSNDLVSPLQPSTLTNSMDSILGRKPGRSTERLLALNRPLLSTEYLTGLNSTF